MANLTRQMNQNLKYLIDGIGLIQCLILTTIMLMILIH
jgi:hypothetical protein